MASIFDGFPDPADVALVPMSRALLRRFIIACRDIKDDAISSEEYEDVEKEVANAVFEVAEGAMLPLTSLIEVEGGIATVSYELPGLDIAVVDWDNVMIGDTNAIDTALETLDFLPIETRRNVEDRLNQETETALTSLRSEWDK